MLDWIIWNITIFTFKSVYVMAELAGAVDYSDCTSA